ncbi:MAG TPA: thiamine phosphate synthase [Vicinamibacterales bacterium]|nr:thiamine phosphate synthase [Vicinamibacterales bacterium]
MTLILGRPMVVMVTDRRRLAEGDVEQCERVIDVAARAARAGVDLIQIREPDLPDRALERLVRGAVGASAATAARIVVNDRTDVALAAGAGGVHLPAASAAARRVRSMVPPGFVIGRSVHSTADAVAADDEEACDYLLFGTVFPTRSKPPGHPVAGLDALRRVCQSVRIPVVAIGGITRERLADVAAAGAAGIAAIGMFADAAGTTRADDGLDRIVQEVRRAFDRRSGCLAGC